MGNINRHSIIRKCMCMPVPTIHFHNIAAVMIHMSPWRQTSHISQGQCPKFLRPAYPWGGCQSCSYAGSAPLWINSTWLSGSFCQGSSSGLGNTKVKPLPAFECHSSFSAGHMLLAFSLAQRLSGLAYSKVKSRIASFLAGFGLWSYSIGVTSGTPDSLPPQA